MVWTWRPNRNADNRPVRHLRPITAMVVAGVLAAACGSSTTTPGNGGSGNTGKVGGKLLIDNESGSTWTCQFNPFNPSVNITSVGFVYEPLEFINILQTNPDGSPKVTPWLATGSTWSPDFTTLTMTIASGVKWSDGTPFSAADVVYTFNALKADPALDLNALWSVDSGPLTSVSLQGTNQVVFTFNAPAQSYFYYVADQTPIIPQHIWSALDQTSSTPSPTRPLSVPGRTSCRPARRTTSSTHAPPTCPTSSPQMRVSFCHMPGKTIVTSSLRVVMTAIVRMRFRPSYPRPSAFIAGETRLFRSRSRCPKMHKANGSSHRHRLPPAFQQTPRNQLNPKMTIPTRRTPTFCAACTKKPDGQSSPPAGKRIVTSSFHQANFTPALPNAAQPPSCPGPGPPKPVPRVCPHRPNTLY